MTIKPLNIDTTHDVTAGVANVSYNGFRFPPAKKASVSFFPEKSDDGRTTKYVRAEIDIEFVWMDYDPLEANQTADYYHGGTTDSSFPTIRQRLCRPGQKLSFIHQGIGSFVIQDGQKWDVNNGPQPTVLSEVPLGGGRAMLVRWHCSTWFADCVDQSGQTGIAQLTFQVSWGIAENGITTRTVTGSLEIPLSRQPSATTAQALSVVRSNADIQREKILLLFPPIKRYQRSQNYGISLDRKTLTFTITDTEIPSANPYFPGIVRMDVSRGASGDGPAFAKWIVTVNATMEVAPSYSMLRAWNAFSVIFDSIFKLKKNAKSLLQTTTSSTDYGGANGKSTDPTAIILGMKINERLYAREVSISIVYMLVCDFASLFDATGMFSNPDISTNDASWQQWSKTMDKIRGPRGYSGQEFDPQTDVIVDLCQPLVTLLNKNDGAFGETPPEGRPTLNRSKQTALTAKNSWMKYDSHIDVYEDNGTIYSVPLKKATPETEQSFNNLPQQISADFDSTQGTGNLDVPTLNTVRDKIFKVHFYGEAIRAQFRIPCPSLTKIGGQDVVKLGTGYYRQSTVGTGTDPVTGNKITIYKLRWSKTYIVKGSPKNDSVESDGLVNMYTSGG